MIGRNCKLKWAGEEEQRFADPTVPMNKINPNKIFSVSGNSLMLKFPMKGEEL